MRTRTSVKKPLWENEPLATPLHVNDYNVLLHYYTSQGDIKLSNAQRFGLTDLTVEKVVNLLDTTVPRNEKTKALITAGIKPKTYYRWRSGECEPMYQNILDLYDYLINRQNLK